jgi:hypothetical protein
MTCSAPDTCTATQRGPCLDPGADPGFGSAHGQLLSVLRSRIRAHPDLAVLWAEWPGSSGLSLAFLESRPWASAMFHGERHRLELRLNSRSGMADIAVQRVNTLINQLNNADIALKGHALVDLHFVGARTQAAPQDATECLISFEALTLHDPPVDDLLQEDMAFAA